MCVKACQLLLHSHGHVQLCHPSVCAESWITVWLAVAVEG